MNRGDSDVFTALLIRRRRADRLGTEADESVVFSSAGIRGLISDRWVVVQSACMLKTVIGWPHDTKTHVVK